VLARDGAEIGRSIDVYYPVNEPEGIRNGRLQPFGTHVVPIALFMDYDKWLKSFRMNGEP